MDDPMTIGQLADAFGDATNDRRVIGKIDGMTGPFSRDVLRVERHDDYFVLVLERLPNDPDEI